MVNSTLSNLNDLLWSVLGQARGLRNKHTPFRGHCGWAEELCSRGHLGSSWERLQAPVFSAREEWGRFPLAIKHFVSEVLHQHTSLLIFQASRVLKGPRSGIGNWVGECRSLTGRRTCVLCPVAIEAGTWSSWAPLGSLMVVFTPRWGPLLRVLFGNLFYKHREQQSCLRSRLVCVPFFTPQVSEDTLQTVPLQLSNVSLTGHFSPPKPTHENLEEAIHHSVHCSYRNGAQTTSVVTVT